MTVDETPETVLRDEIPAQFKAIRESLHAELERVMAVAQDWRPGHIPDSRDIRSAQLLGETLLRIQSSLGSLSDRHDVLEGLRG